MAGKSEELNTRLTATDKASAVVDKLADKLEAIEDTDHEATLTADDKATADVTALDKRLDKLTDEQRIVILRAQAKQAQSEVDGLTRKLAQAWKYDNDTLELFVEERGNAETRLDAISAELRSLDGDSAKVEVTADTAKAEASIDDVAKKLGELDGPIGVVGAQLGKLASPGGAIAGIAGGLLLAGNYAADVAIEADNLARLTGDSVEEASKLNAVWKQGGFDAKDLQDVMLQMGGVLSTNAGLAAQLGINLNDGRSLGERFAQVVGLLETKFDNVAERSVAASQLFGEEGVRQVNAVIASVGDLETALAAADDAAVNPEDVEAAREFKAETRALTADMTKFAASVGKVAVPVMSGLVNLFNDGFAGAEEFGRNLRGVFDGGAADEARVYADAIDGAELAAANFDKTTLDNAKSLDEVRAIASKYANGALTDADAQLHAVNLIANEWNQTLEDEAAAAKEAARQELLLSGALSQAGESARGADDMVEGLAAAQDVAAAAADRHREAEENLMNFIDGKLSSVFDYDQAINDLSISNNNLADKIEETQTAYEDGTLAGDDYATALHELQNEEFAAAEQALDAAKAFAQSKGAIDGSKASTDLQKQELQRLQGVFPQLRDEIQQYIDILNRIPGTVTTNVINNGASVGNRRAPAPSNAMQAFDTGGVVQGPRGSEQVILAHAGETVLPTHKGGVTGAGVTNNYITINAGVKADAPEIGRLVVDAIKKYERGNSAGWRKR